jgi:hypothetical protein
MGYRIEYDTPQRRTRSAQSAPDTQNTDYITRLAVLIPAEATTMYVALKGLAGEWEGNEETAIFILFVVGLLLSLWLKATATVAPEEGDFRPDWAHVGLSAVAFVIWSYAIANPFLVLGVPTNPFIAMVVVAGFTLMLPGVHKWIRLAQARQAANS